MDRYKILGKVNLAQPSTSLLYTVPLPTVFENTDVGPRTDATVLYTIVSSIIISNQSSVMLVLGLIDQLRQVMQGESKRVIERPKGSKSSSKFDIYINEIIDFIKEKKSVSEMARLLKVSRSSLKDYIESRELKQVANGSLLPQEKENAEQEVIDTIACPNTQEEK